MSLCKQIGKDKIIYATKKDHETPSIYPTPPALPNEKRPGVIAEDGSINWACPCLGALPYGPCGYEFRKFFSCLHSSQEAENPDAAKAENCYPMFTSMKECFSQFPKLFPPDDQDDT